MVTSESENTCRDGQWLGGAVIILMGIDPVITRAEIPVLCARLADLRYSSGAGPAVVVCDLSATVDPSVVTVEALARLRLTAGRLGASLLVRGVGPRLRRLLALTGLDGVLLLAGTSALKPRWQVEQREQPIDVQEVGDAADPTA